MLNNSDVYVVFTGGGWDGAEYYEFSSLIEARKFAYRNTYTNTDSPFGIKINNTRYPIGSKIMYYDKNGAHFYCSTVKLNNNMVGMYVDKDYLKHVEPRDRNVELKFALLYKNGTMKYTDNF